jgi:phytoene synthase
MADLDPDRTLALSYVPARDRPAVDALWRLDAALGAVVSAGREPLISQIKLAWWRDSLEKLDRERAPAEPALEAAAREILPRGVTGAELSGMEEAWTVLLTPEELSPNDLDSYAAARGGLLFSLSARLLGGAGDTALQKAGESWALADLARHSANAPDRDAALAAALARMPDHPRRWPARLRPLGMLAALARRDAEWRGGAPEPQGSPGRMLRMLGHRLTGH